MGEAKTKREMQEARRAARRAAAEKAKTMPIRIVKGLMAALLWPVILTCMLGWECFENNRWPWRTLK